MAASDLVLAMTGASGSLYGLRLLEVLLASGRSVHLTMSPAAAEVLATECGRTVDLNHFRAEQILSSTVQPLDLKQLHYHHFRDFRAGIASGSFQTGGMIVCPCSMGTVAAIAHGISQNLIHRAADVHLKERRKLIMVPRETPLGLVQLRNLTAVAEAGAIVLPAMPGFYHQPSLISDLIDFVVARVCDQLGVEHHLAKRWGSHPTVEIVD